MTTTRRFRHDDRGRRPIISSSHAHPSLVYTEKQKSKYTNGEVMRSKMDLPLSLVEKHMARRWEMMLALQKKRKGKTFYTFQVHERRGKVRVTQPHFYFCSLMSSSTTLGDHMYAHTDRYLKSFKESAETRLLCRVGDSTRLGNRHHSATFRNIPSSTDDHPLDLQAKHKQDVDSSHTDVTVYIYKHKG